MNKSMNKNAQKIYLICALIYVLALPILVMGMNSLKLYSNVLFDWHMLTLIISLTVIITFVYESKKDKNKLKKFKSIKYILLFFTLFFICSIVSTILSSNFILSFFGTDYRANGLLQLFSYVGYALLGISLNKENRTRILRVICYVSFSMALMHICENEFTNIIFANYNPYSAIFNHYNHYGYYLVYTIIITIFLFFHDKNQILKIIDFMVYMTLLYMLVINDTLGCYLAVLFTVMFLLVYCIKERIISQYILLIIPFIIISIFAKTNNEYVVYRNFKQLVVDIGIISDRLNININDGKQSENYESSENEQNQIFNSEGQVNYDEQLFSVGTYRGELWLHAIKYTKEKPIFGYGLDNLTSRYMEDGIMLSMPHNLILCFTASIGIPGTIFYLVAVLLVIIRGIKNKEKNHLINLAYFVVFAHLISSMFGNTMYYVTPYYAIILGMGMLVLNEEDLSNS